MIEELTDYLSRQLSRRLKEMPKTLAPSVYAMSLLIDYQSVELVFTVNTHQQVALALSGVTSPFGMPSDEGEARWNYAFWMRHPSMRLLTPPESRDGVLWQELLRQKNLIYSDDDDFDIEVYEESVVELMAKVASSSARKLHELGTIISVFGRVVPILVHDLEYPDEVCNWTKLANPPGVASEFISWVTSLGANE